MNDYAIEGRLIEHSRDALAFFPSNRTVGIFLQGSQNYQLDIETSDVDTKLIVTPTFQEIAFNKKPVSTTFIRSNDEHIDFKDIRLMIECFKKQNLNFLEILFTRYHFCNPLYMREWQRLVNERERIARYNPYQTVKSMKGIAMEKFHALEHPYPSKIEILKKYGFDPKQLHHLLRVEDYLERYIAGEAYEDCLVPRDPSYLKAVKRGNYTLEEARKEAIRAKLHIEQMAERFCADRDKNDIDKEMDELLDDVQFNIMKIAIKQDLLEE